MKLEKSESNSDEKPNSKSKPDSKPKPEGMSKPESKPKPENKLQVHKHKWIETFKIIHHEEKEHYENVLVRETWIEKIPKIQMDEHSICSTYVRDIIGMEFDHLKSNPGCSGFYSDWQEIIVCYGSIKHPAEYEDKYVADKKTWNEKYL